MSAKDLRVFSIKTRKTNSNTESKCKTLLEKIGLGDGTTRTNSVPDAGKVDLGYNAESPLGIYLTARKGLDITTKWNSFPEKYYIVVFDASAEGIYESKQSHSTLTNHDLLASNANC